MSNASQPTPAPPKRNEYGWILFFAFIIIASIGVTVFMIWFNYSIQLTPEKPQEARKLWREKGPTDYKLRYTKQLNDNPKLTTFVVKVGGGKVEEVLMDGKPLEPDKETRHDPRPYHTMDALMNDIERTLDQDRKPDKPKVYVTASFDPSTGALRHYIRRVMGSNQRIEMHLKLEPLTK